MRAKGLLDKQPHRRNRKAGLLGTYSKDGKIVIRSLAKGQAKQKTAIAALNQSTFAQQVAALKSAVDKDMISAVELQAGTTLLWRDILMMAQNGTLWTFKLPDGNIMMGVRQLSQTIQNLLDAISDVDGVILGRANGQWQALLPGPMGYVLTSQGPGTPPIYAEAKGGGSGGGISDLASKFVQSSSVTRWDAGVAATAKSMALPDETTQDNIILFITAGGTTTPTFGDSGWTKYTTAEANAETISIYQRRAPGGAYSTNVTLAGTTGGQNAILIEATAPLIGPQFGYSSPGTWTDNSQAQDITIWNGFAILVFDQDQGTATATLDVGSVGRLLGQGTGPASGSNGGRSTAYVLTTETGHCSVTWSGSIDTAHAIVGTVAVL